jgi:fatty-acyl-CoA synthase
MRYPGVAAPVPWPLDSGVAANSDDWIETGDAGWLDDAGNLYLVGRVDDIILRGGRLVSLDGVTERIRQSCDVLDAVVIATDDAYLGADILAAVVLPDDTTLDDVLACMRTSLLPHELPTFVRQVASVPRTRSGKVDRPATRELLIRMSGQGTT